MNTALQRRTRRSALAIQGAAHDTAVGRLTAAPRGSASREQRAFMDECFAFDDELRKGGRILGGEAAP